MQYLTRARLAKAATALRNGPATLVEIAHSIGYDSEVAFSKAFKRSFGMAPGAYRQNGRAMSRTAREGAFDENHSLNGTARASSPSFEASLPRQRRET